MTAEIATLVRSFARQLRAEGKAARTIKLYSMSATMFADHLEANGHEPTVGNLTRPLIREWLAALSETKSAGTVRTRYRGLHRFCSWLVDEDELDEHPMRNISPPAVKAPPVPVLSDEELAALMKVVNGKTFLQRRDEAIVRVLLDTGVRVSELCGLTVEGVDLDNGMALVNGKGGKIRPVYLSTRTVAALDRYIRVRAQHRHAGHAALFLTSRGPLSVDGARDVIRQRGKQAGIEGLHPHVFRHTFAHDFLMAGRAGTRPQSDWPGGPPTRCWRGTGRPQQTFVPELLRNDFGEGTGYDEQRLRRTDGRERREDPTGGGVLRDAAKAR